MRNGRMNGKGKGLQLVLPLASGSEVIPIPNQLGRLTKSTRDTSLSGVLASISSPSALNLFLFILCKVMQRHKRNTGCSTYVCYYCLNLR